jgi:hypothetical protein
VALFLTVCLRGLALLGFEGAAVDSTDSFIGAAIDSFAATDTKAVDLPFFSAFVFLERPPVDSMGSSKRAVVDSSVVDGTEWVDLLSFPALVFLLGGATADLVDPCTKAVVDSSAADGTKSGDLPCFTDFTFLEGAFLEEEAVGAGFLGVFSKAGSAGASLLLPLPRFESIISRSSTTLTELLQPSGR